MHITYSSLLGMLFLGLALAATFTMFQFWGYPYDEEKKKSSCPQWKMNIHRGLGFAYIIVYILMMTEMVPRLWEYQVEFPARTVAHTILGSLIGIILMLKVSILRFFRHFEEWMPTLGVSLLVCSILLGVLSLPSSLRERALAENVYSAENRARVAKLLPAAGYPEGTEISELSTEKSLASGREVLLEKCIACHDLKTIIAKPRTPADWVRTSKRMVDKPSLGVVLSQEEGHRAAAYLIAITPDLQRSAKEKRKGAIALDDAKDAVMDLLRDDEGTEGTDPVTDPTTLEIPETPAVDLQEPIVKDQSASGTDTQTPDASMAADPPKKPKAAKPKAAKPKPKPTKPKYDFKEAKALFNDECSLCHSTSDVDDAPPTTRKDVDQMMSRMVDNGLDLEKEDLAKIRFYLRVRYLKK